MTIDAPLVIRPSLGAYANAWVRNISLPAVGIVLAFSVYRLILTRSSGALFLIIFVVMALVAVRFFVHARIVLDSNQLSYRRLFIGRRYPISRVAGLAIRRVALRSNSYATRPPQYAVVYDHEKRAIFAFSAALWPAADLERLQQTIGGDASDRPLEARELQDEFPGALPGWLVFYNGHPVWALVIGVPLALVVIVVGIILWDLLTTGKP